MEGRQSSSVPPARHTTDSALSAPAPKGQTCMHVHKGLPPSLAWLRKTRDSASAFGAYLANHGTTTGPRFLLGSEVSRAGDASLQQG